jgi:hypothetical protein
LLYAGKWSAEAFYRTSGCHAGTASEISQLLAGLVCALLFLSLRLHFT